MTEINGQGRLEQARSLLTANRLKEAEAVLKGLICEEPRNAEAFNLLGAVWERRGGLEEAGLLYRVALVINPAYAPARHNLNRLVRMPPELGGIDLSHGRHESESHSIEKDGGSKSSGATGTGKKLTDKGSN